MLGDRRLGEEGDHLMEVEPPPTASIVVLAYNSAATLGACLSALQPQVEELGGELVVVDNASSDDSARIAANHATKVVVSRTNRGFSGGCNLGVAHGTGAVVVLVNPDTVVDPGGIRALIETARGGVHAPVGGRARHADGAFDPRCVLGRPRLRGAICFSLGLDTLFRGNRWFDPEHGPPRIDQQPSVVEVEAVSGALMAVERRLWDALGGLDEDFFLYGEDVDLCLRATSAGFRPAVATAAGYTHVGGMTADPTARRHVLLFRGKAELYRKHLPDPAATLAVVCLQVGSFLRGVPASLPVPTIARRARPWRQLFRQRRDWRHGHRRRVPAQGTAS